MAGHGYGRSPGWGRSHGRVRRPARRLSPEQRAALGHLKERIFTFSPRQLGALLQSTDTGETGVLFPERETPEDVLPDPDVDMDDRDDDVLEDPDELSSDAPDLAVTLQGLVIGPPESVLDLGNVYALHCTATDCHFEPFSWMRSSHAMFGQQIQATVVFLEALAAWLGSEKKRFLESPGCESFVAGETEFSRDAIVTQQGLLERVKRSYGASAAIDKSTLSRLSNKVWLVWTEQVMPLRALFGREFHLAWVALGCLAGLSSPAQWTAREADIQRMIDQARSRGTDLPALKRDLRRRGWRGLDQRQRLLFMCDKVSVNWKEGLRVVERYRDEALSDA